MLPARSLIVDLFTLQHSQQTERGIPRTVMAMTDMLLQTAPRVIHSLAIDGSSSMTPALERFRGTAPLRRNGPLGPGDVPPGGPVIYHVTSPFELAPIDIQWPAYAREEHVLTVVTLYDLIPLIFPEQYLGDPLVRTLYTARTGLIRQADLVLTLSEHAARDATRILGVDPERIVVIGAGVDHRYEPSDRIDALSRVADALPDVRPGYVMYTGGADHRKNIRCLIEAYAMTSSKLRREHQLVIACRMTGEERTHYDRIIEEAGVAAEVHITGLVDDPTLIALYQATDLFVSPSLYEGFGLPIAEALRCGAPTIASDAASIPEIVPDPAHRFDPTDPEALAATMERALGDQAFSSGLRAAALAAHERFQWEEVVGRMLAGMADAYDSRWRPTSGSHVALGSVPRAAHERNPADSVPDLSLVKACELEDFSHPALRPLIREIFSHELLRFGPDFPTGVEYRKHWEVAMAARALRDSGVLTDESEVLGIGAGNEPTIYWLTLHAGRVFATDLYLAGGAWDAEANRVMLTDPGYYWPNRWNPRRLVVQHMDALDLQYEDESFDAIFSSSSIEHFGDHDDIQRSVDEMFRVLKPGGVLSLSTELRLEGPAPGLQGAVLFSPDELLDCTVGSRQWHLVDEPSFSVSPRTLQHEVQFEEALADLKAHRDRYRANHFAELAWTDYPHISLRNGGHLWTSVHIALRRD